MSSGRTNNFLWKWAWPRSRDPTIFGIWSNISLKLLELEISNLTHGFVWAMPSRRTNKFPWKWAWTRSRDPTILGSTVGYLSDSWSSFVDSFVTSKNVKWWRLIWVTVYVKLCIVDLLRHCVDSNFSWSIKSSQFPNYLNLGIWYWLQTPKWMTLTFV